MRNDTFFRNAALALCGNLKIELAMRECIRTIKEYMPVDHMVLQIYEPDLHAMRAIATASGEEAKSLDTLIPMSESARERLGKRLDPTAHPVVIIDSTEKNPVTPRSLMKTA